MPLVIRGTCDAPPAQAGCPQVWLANQTAHYPDWLARQLVKKLPLARVY